MLRKSLRRRGSTETIVTDRLASYGAALKVLGDIDKREIGRWLNNRAECSHQPFRRQERAMLRFRRMRNRRSSKRILQKFAPVHGQIHNQFASRPFGSTRNDTSHPGQCSRKDEPPHSPHGVNFARHDPCRGRGLSETFLVCPTQTSRPHMTAPRWSVSRFTFCRSSCFQRRSPPGHVGGPHGRPGPRLVRHVPCVYASCLDMDYSLVQFEQGVIQVDGSVCHAGSCE